MTENDRDAIKLDIWRAMMARTQTYVPQPGTFVAGGMQYTTVTPAAQPLEAAKQVQAVFDAIYPPAKKCK